MKREILDIFDENFILIGHSDYKTIHDKGFWHQVIHCWIMDPTSHLVIYQKRGKNKIIYPEMLDVSVAGHCRIHENPEITVKREAHEELGIKIDRRNLVKIGLRKNISSSENNTNKEFQHIYFYKMKIDPNKIKINNSEIQYIVLLNPEDVREAIETRISIDGIKLKNGSYISERISYKEFIPSIDNYNLIIPLTIKEYLNGERQLYFNEKIQNSFGQKYS